MPVVPSLIFADTFIRHTAFRPIEKDSGGSKVHCAHGFSPPLALGRSVQAVLRTPVTLDQHYVIKFCMLLDNDSMETVYLIKEVFKDDSFSKFYVNKWQKMFKDSRE